MKKQLVIAALLSSFSFFGAEVDINGNFMASNPKDTALPLNWDRNWKQRNDIGSSILEKGSSPDRRAIRITTKTFWTHFFFQKRLPAIPGKTLNLSFDARGTGNAGAIFYIYDANGKYLRTEVMKAQAVKKDFSSFGASYKIPPEVLVEGKKDVKAVPAFYTPGMYAAKESDVAFENIRITEQ